MYLDLPNTKKVIEAHDLKAIATYLENASESPIIPCQAVWYSLAIHFVRRGTEFHQQLKLDSFSFLRDENGEYVQLTHETQQKNYQGGLTANEAPTGKRMLLQIRWHVRWSSLDFLLKRLIQAQNFFFNHNIKESNQHAPLWFTGKSLSAHTFTRFMCEICIAAGVDRYTNHCLRATAIQHMNDWNVESRHILFVTGHRNESSIRSYNRSFSSTQQHSLSNALAAVAQGKEFVPRENVPISSATSTSGAVSALPNLLQQASSTSLPRLQSTVKKF